MEVSPDTTIFWQWGPVVINATLVYSWVVMILLVGISWLITRNLSKDLTGRHFQSALEAFIVYFQNQIESVVGSRDIARYLPFIATLFLFIAAGNILGLAPLFQSPAASLSTTAALAVCVFFAVPTFGIIEKGFKDYLRNYIQPNPIMLPFHVISEISRTFALAIRLFGNVMSGSLLISIMISVIPWVFPVALQALELLVGVIQAYIFAILALVYIASAVQTQREN